MNDPGLDGPIAENANAIEKALGGEEEEETDAYLAFNRWWFASTALPLVAGTFGPMANAFSICSLVESWRVTTPPGGKEDEITDPKWLMAINAMSLVFALVANISLLLNMAHRLSFSVAQPITIIGWYISSFLLIVLVALAIPILQRPLADVAFTQAYYYGIMAAAIYFLISSLMVVNVFGAYKGHYPREFNLTTSQRTLMLQSISFLVYLLSGAAVFAHIEGWMFLDAVYWADFTLLTVGIGDYAPATHKGRALLFPFAIGGILIIGLVIGSIRSLVLERGKKRVGVRLVEKERMKVLTKLNNGDRKALVAIQSGKALNSDHSISSGWGRKEEFELMRKIQHRAARTRRWISLFVSAGAWFVLLFLGALVFMKCEHGQSWSYFQSLYFAYTSLLTIGYGDLYPTSKSGKPFFVCWSLLAVPTMTVLIGNMGDTIVKGIKDLTLWIGEWTILPGESPMKEVLKKGMARFPGGKKWMSESDPEEQDRGDHHNTDTNPTNHTTKSGPNNGKPPPPHPTALIQEIRRVISHLNTTPHHKYSFHEWTHFLHLISDGKDPALSHLASGPKARDEKRRTTNFGEENGERKWSWMGKSSPLIGKKSEPEWVLERLLGRLEAWLEERGKKEGFRG